MPPDEPESDAITEHIIFMYSMATRSRRYLSGGAGVVPMPLGPAEIEVAVRAYGSPLPRKLLDAAVFGLDSSPEI